MSSFNWSLTNFPQVWNNVTISSPFQLGNYSSTRAYPFNICTRCHKNAAAAPTLHFNTINVLGSHGTVNLIPSAQNHCEECLSIVKDKMKRKETIDLWADALK